MKAGKRKRIEAAGWTVGSAYAFLGLSEADALLVEVQLALGAALRERRIKAGLTQAGLAKRLRSSQSRVAKMETGDPTVSVDLLIRSLFVLGASPKQIGLAIGA